ncbi:hypothetical protein ACG7TL_004394 [Trametes sanguinea]
MQFFTVLAAFIALATSSTTMASPTSPLVPSIDLGLVERAAQYGNHCGANTKCTPSLRANCEVAIALIDPDTMYGDQSQFSASRCYMIYDTGGAGENPVSGQVIIDTAKAILLECAQTCGSYGTNNAGCTTCHVTINYRA